MPVSDKKRAYGQRICGFIEKYRSAFVVHCDNVGSKQMSQVRVSLRGQADVLMGKNVSNIICCCSIGCGHFRQERVRLNFMLTSPTAEFRLVSADHHPQGDQGLPEEERGPPHPEPDA